jgi:ABC-2 type transport system ATP-binding protein
VARLSAAGIRSLTSQPPTLEELFLRHYQTDGDRR